ncbi:MAG: DUF3090 family protein, partial [Actinomycetes bacterium]
GEAIALDEGGRPRPFQETASRTAMGEGVEVTAYFFDLLHVDGRDLLDEPGSVRLAALADLVPEASQVPRIVTDDPAEAQAFAERADRVINAGRKPCPLCGEPLDPAGHVCPRQNGYRRTDEDETD